MQKLLNYPKVFANIFRSRRVIGKLVDSRNFVFVRDFAPGHFYSPLPDLDQLDQNASAIFNQTVKDIPGVDNNEAVQLKLTEEFGKLYPEIPFSKTRSGELRYYFDNPFFSYGDGVVLYSFLRHFQPKRIVEVGSGYSSAEMLDVNDLFFNGAIDFTFVEPFPERLRSLLSEKDCTKHRVEVTPVQHVDLSVFTALEANDILFVDSSHVGKIGSDLLHILFQVLPRLKPGVIIHFHDIPWPFEYPRHWVEGGRAWNEAYFLRAFLQFNSSFELLYSNSFMVIHHAEFMRKLMPLFLEKSSIADTESITSLWIRKLQ
jgi:hypothetical protein